MLVEDVAVATREALMLLSFEIAEVGLTLVVAYMGGVCDFGAALTGCGPDEILEWSVAILQRMV